MYSVLSKVKLLPKNINQRSALRQDSYGWQNVWEDIVRYLSQLSLMVSDIIPEHV